MLAVLECRHDRWCLRVNRTKTDNPIVDRPVDCTPATRLKPGEYNSWRKDYLLSFDSESEAKAALAKVEQIGDFDKAAAWLDKQ